MARLLARTTAMAMLVAGVGPACAYEGPWCAHYFGTDYTTSCSLTSFAMCLRETRGIPGTFCSPNPIFRAEPRAPDADELRRRQPHHS